MISGLTGPLIHKLESTRSLRSQLEGTLLSIPRGQDIVRAGDRPNVIYILVAGFACRYTLLSDGKRQITFFHVPGDMLNLPSLLLPGIDYDLCSLARSQVLAISREATLTLLHKHPGIADLFWREMLVYAAIGREWVVRIGRRHAFARLAHLLCELIVRLQAVGFALDYEIELRLTQADIGDALGLSTIHVNRTLQALRRAGLITLTRNRLKALDWKGLCDAGGFDPAYLHQSPSAHGG